MTDIKKIYHSDNGNSLNIDTGGALKRNGIDITPDLDKMAGVTATAAELNAAADVGTRVVSIADAATYTVLAANSGKTHVVPDLSQDIAIALPAAAAGLEYRFLYSGVAADTSDWEIDTGSDTNFFLGGLFHLDTDAGPPTTFAVVAPDGDSNSVATVLTPEEGTIIDMVCDGTNWILSGHVASATVPDFADQA